MTIELKDLVRMPKGTYEVYDTTDDPSKFGRLATSYAHRAEGKIEITTEERHEKEGEVIKNLTRVTVVKQGREVKTTGRPKGSKNKSKN